MPGCGLLVPTETNLLDVGLLPFEADTVLKKYARRYLYLMF
jgi:hypothetical protein